jgi:hypothetical protein
MTSNAEPVLSDIAGARRIAAQHTRAWIKLEGEWHEAEIRAWFTQADRRFASVAVPVAGITQIRNYWYSEAIIKRVDGERPIG